MTLDVSQYRHISFERRPHGVLVISIGSPGPHEPGGRLLHDELAGVWLDFAADPDLSIAVLTGTLGSTTNVDAMLQISGNYAASMKVLREGLNLVHNIINCDKPIVSVITGAPSGAGLATALLADISIADENAVLRDSHIRQVGVVAGDHAAMIWPLLCGLAKTKYHVLTSEPLDGAQAERIGLISRAVPEGDALDTALKIADDLATSPQHALRWTKRALNHWLRNASPIFEASIAFEALSVFGDDHREALHAAKEQRAPEFSTSVPW